MPVLEAMACGAPVISSTSSALPEICGGAAAAMVSPDRPGEHLEAILGLLDDHPAQQRASDAGQAHARTFTWERSADQLMQAFAALL